MASPTGESVAKQLLAQRETFKAFLASRLGDAAEAEDLLQNALLKAIARAGEIKDEEKAMAWFYRVLRSALVDHVRSRNAAARREQAWADEAGRLAEDAATERALCRCFERMLPALKPTQAELLRRVELEGQPVAEAARELGLTPNHASVELHRARAALRAKLIDFCGACSCLTDCQCD